MESKNLFSPIKVGNMSLNNRIAMAPMGSNLGSHEGYFTDKQIDYYIERAKGGTGLIIVEDTTVDDNAIYIFDNLRLTDDKFIDGWKRLADEVHKYGTKIMPQLIHPSFNARESLSGRQPIAASPTPSRAYREMPKEATIEQLEEIIEMYGQAALRAKKAGCDGVQIHAAHCHHLLGSFLSSSYNKRTDKYGGSLFNRAKLLIEVIRKIKETAGEDFPVTVRISGDEYTFGGNTVEDAQYVSRLLEQNGVDAINVSAGTTFGKMWYSIAPMSLPKGVNVELSKAIKEVVTIPVMAVGRVTEPFIAEEILATGKADILLIARSLLADPAFANKAEKGCWDEIRPCIGCMHCINQALTDQEVRCTTNPYLGNESETIETVENAKNILVIGGGPAGMQSAITAASKGHNVTLVEKDGKLGGQLIIAAMPPGKQDITKSVQYLVKELKNNNVLTMVNTSVDKTLIEKINPDEVILATGGDAIVPNFIKGADLKHVLTAWDVLKGKKMPWGKTVVIGGGMVGCETADYIANPIYDMHLDGAQVSLIEMEDNICRDEPGLGRTILVRNLKEKDVQILTNSKVEEITENTVRYTINGEQITLENIDNVVLALGTKSNNSLLDLLKDMKIKTHVIGDAKVVKRAAEAIYSGYEVGKNI